MALGAWVAQVHSWLFLTALVDNAKVVLIHIGVIVVDFDDFRNKAPAGSSSEMHKDIHRISNVRFNCPIRQYVRAGVAPCRFATSYVNT